MTKAYVEKFNHEEEKNYSKTVFGFWLYLLTDFILFGTLFAVYEVLVPSTFGGTPPGELYDLPYALILTLLITFCAYTAGIGNAYSQRGETKKGLLFFGITFFLGLIFFGMQLGEFARFINTGNGWQNSAFLSAYFTLTGTFSAHIFFALLWTILLSLPVLKNGLNPVSIRRLMCLRMFWQFLSVVWIFIFTIVYLLGEVQ